MYKIISITILGLLISEPVLSRNFKTVEGGALYLKRLDYETLRAEFMYSEDCEMVAKIMSEAEPNVEWYCSTSVDTLEYKCTLPNVTIIDHDGQISTESYSMRMFINRGKAEIYSKPSIPHIYSYKKAGEYTVLTTTDEGNYIANALHTLRINTTSGEIAAINNAALPNGTGTCKKVEQK